MKKLIMILMIFGLAISLIGCKKEGEDPVIEDPSYYKKMVMNEDKHLKVFMAFNDGTHEVLNKYELGIAVAIEGIFAREHATYYLVRNNQDIFWLNQLKDNYGITYEYTTFNDMVNDFKAEYPAKYVLFDWDNLESCNSAFSLAGAFDILPVSAEYKDKMEQLGFSMEIDASTMSEKKCFNTYKEHFCNDGLVQLGFKDTAIYYLKDYQIACKYFITYQKDSFDPDCQKQRASVLAWVKKDSPTFGWIINDENEDVGISSNYSLYTLASDYCCNMSLFTCLDAFNVDAVVQPNENTTVKAEAGKHYITFMMSDGDNCQIWYNSFATDSRYYGMTRHEGFKFGWSIQPSLIELGPAFIKYVYDHASPSDQFVCAVSGQGYMNPQNYTELAKFTQNLDYYLKKTDLSVIQILDSTTPNEKVLNCYSSVPSLKGAFYCFGNKYAGGAGSVYWCNDKPFVTIRESLWSTSIESMAARINSYAKDPTSIYGYTAINVHAWSMTYEDAYRLTQLLDEDVVVVYPEEFIELITNNVKHENVIIPYVDYETN